MRVFTQPLSCVAFAFIPSLAWAQPSFQGLGDLPGGYFFSRAEAVSGDGSVVVGYSVGASGNEEAFRWTAADGMQALGDLPGGAVRSIALGVSHDGAVIVGKSVSGTYPSEAFRWTAAAGMESFPQVFPQFYCGSGAVDVSDDGQVILGWWSNMWSTCNQPGFFNSSGGGFRLVWPSGWMDRWSWIELHTNSDGTILVGGGGGSPPARYIFYPDGWTEVQFLGTASGLAHDVSPDGNVVVGRLSPLGQAFCWSAIGDVCPPLQSPDWFDTDAKGVSADGGVVVGNGSRGPFIADRLHGIRPLQEVLEVDFALDLTGWRLSQALDVSDDGKTIVGIGEHVGNSPEAWVAHLPTYPVPVIPTVSAPGLILLTILLTGAGTVVLTRRRCGCPR